MKALLQFNPSRFVRAAPFITVFVMLLAANASALTCDDIEELDAMEQAGGAFSLWTGCRPVSAQIVADHWSNLPEIAQIVFAAYYEIPGQRMPDLSEGSRADSDQELTVCA